MRVLIVFAHPEPRSFNGALRDVATATLQELGHEVDVSDLYALGFDPLEAPRHFAKPRDPDRFNAQAEQRHAWEQGTTSTDVEAEIDKLDRADLVLFQYPIWWFSMPAILKGWLDRVFTYGGLYTGRMRFDRGRFRNKRAMLSVTSGSPDTANAHNGRNADVNMVLWPMNYSLHYVGFQVLPAFIASGVRSDNGSDRSVVRARLEGHRRALETHLRTLQQRPPLPFNTHEHWDATARLLPEAPSFSPFIRHARSWSSAEPGQIVPTGGPLRRS